MNKTLAAIVLTAVSATSFAASEFQNGNFESYTTPFSGYQVQLVGSTDITGWTIGGTSVDLIKGWPGTIDGTSVDMQGSPGPGTLSQTFATVAGQHYSVGFDLWRNMAGTDDPSLSVTVTGSGPQSFTAGDTVGHYTLDFVALGSSSTLTFSSGNISAYGGAVLDNVTVTAVPEPETYAMLLAGLGLMGAVVRRRKLSA